MATRIGKKRAVYNFYDHLEYPEYEYQEYPKMLYHPKGETEVLSHGDVQATAWGPELRNQKKAVITRIVNNSTEEKAAVAAGWKHTIEESLEEAAAVAAPAKASPAVKSAAA